MNYHLDASRQFIACPDGALLFGGANAPELCDELNRLLAQRDALLAALNGIIAAEEGWNGSDFTREPTGISKLARAATKECEQ